MTIIMKPSRSSKKLQGAFESSPFEDIKFFVDPNSKSSNGACTEEAIELIPELMKVKSSERKAEFSY